MDFKKIDGKFRSMPFWSWNDRLKTEETKRQIAIMDKAGIGGFFMHARGGLKTEYMEDEWFENVEASIEEAKERGMRPWAYDENGWPSGFGNGLVNGRGIDYQQKMLRFETELEHKETHIAKVGDMYFYYDVNEFYVDTLNKQVAEEFLDKVYNPYYERFFNDIEGFFTDEPAISRFGIPWSFILPDEYKKRYNDDLIPRLPELFTEKGDYKQTRINFWSLVTDLFSENFFKTIYEWCEERDLKLTGHLVCEEEILTNNLPANGSCMPHYEYFHIPGVDWLGRMPYPWWQKASERGCVTARQASSVAEQLGKEAVLTETYAMCGHSLSFAEMKGLMEWQMVRGVNLLCQHLSGYTLAGIRKRDYPPAMYYQQGWWSEYKVLNEAIAREGTILGNGEKCVDTLLISPQTTAWSLYNNKDTEPQNELNYEFLRTTKKLERKHIEFHLGDETIMRRHARVENGKLIIGKQSYSVIIKENCRILMPHTEKLLKEFELSGGKILTSDEIKANNITDCEELTYTSRIIDGKKLHFFVNTSENEFTARINAKGLAIDIFTGETSPFSGSHSFEPWGSLMVLEDETVEACEKEKTDSYITLTGDFEVDGPVENCLTLDKCDYYFDGELQEKNGYVLNICERACKLGRKVKIHQDYYVNIADAPSELFLVCETPDNFIIKINGTEIDKADKGYYRDKAFRKINIQEYLKKGENIISFDCDFLQSDKFYEDFKNVHKFEAVKNKLVYDMEIEAIYLVGDFSVRTDGKWEELEKEALRYSGGFVIDKPVEKISLSEDLTKQGFLFFCGELSLKGSFETKSDNPTLKVSLKGVNALKLETDGKAYMLLTDSKTKLSVKKGKYDIRLTLFNSLRNMLGPHHDENGELHIVGPADFYKEAGVWRTQDNQRWNESYCFVKTGVFPLTF